MSSNTVIPAEFPAKLAFLFQPARYKVAFGGRAGTKSWGFARALLLQASERPLKILCAREYQNSIRDSVHALLKLQVDALGLGDVYQVQQNDIRGKNGTSFIFRGIANNPQEIKSMEGIDIAWVEEAQKVSDNSWEILIPTIRKSGSEIWISFNPRHETDPTWVRFVKRRPPGAVVQKVGWRDNPWLTAEMIAEKEYLKRIDPDSYEYVWEGGFEVVRQGAYYHRLLREAEDAGRICSVPYDPAVPVHTSWDIGVDDETVIWFWQALPGGELHVIDYLDGRDEGIEYYLGEMDRRKYLWGTDYVPHDFQARNFAAGGRSAAHIAKNHGRNLHVVRRMNPNDRVQATRLIIPKCWFDKAKCDRGLEALRNYRREYDDDRQTYKNQPVHDWASHGADAFGTFAVAFRDERDPFKQDEDEHIVFRKHSDSGWMAA